ncbi:hypothetical protein K7640_00510 [Micromonospora sp. PLK6-60]|uniref:hypothetical protein n=1 Tax=Micromonospora sp. PLK6-60 TaxID=2873383 RepID=UPI001CA716AB|nr:hypothetical protein [Micromonospora sp. PLK6-60]MBY8870323.1 hypothetical protein [Micromonospora sp. PLK6-60]
MNLVIALAGPISALLGVWLGTTMTGRVQERALRQEQDRRTAEVKRTAYTGHLTALRAYIAYVTSHAPEISVIRDGGSRPRPAFSGRGHEVREALETSYTALQLVAAEQETVNQAHLVSRAARRIAVAAADRDPTLPDKLLVFWDLERGLVNQLRRELGQPLPLANAYDADATLP